MLPESQPSPGEVTVGLRRSVTLLPALLYGLGVTIGAGIYVLIGAAAARAGMHAPLAFIAGAGLMVLTAASFAELACRMPVAAGEAAYVREAFDAPALGTLVGVLVIAIAIVSTAAISVGSAGYIGVLVPLPEPAIITAVVVAMSAIAGWGIRESIGFAGLMTVVEVGGLLVLILTGIGLGPDLVKRLPEALPAVTDQSAMAGLASASLLAVFAFTGFEGLVNIAEEVREPSRTLPRAIFLTLFVTTVLYVLVVWVALVAVSPGELAASRAPLALVFERLTGAPPQFMGLIAVVATLNGIIVQIIMASRVVYGLAGQGRLPQAVGAVHPTTRTPLRATVLAGVMVLALALAFPLDRLAELSAQITLMLFALINLALARIKMRGVPPPPGIFLAPRWVPWAGAASCAGLVLADVLA